MNLLTPVILARSTMIAILDRSHARHKDAAVLFGRLIDRHAEIWITNYVLVQLDQVLDHEAYEVLRGVVAEFFHVYWVGQDADQEACAERKATHNDTAPLSDFVTRIVAKKLGARLVECD